MKKKVVAQFVIYIYTELFSLKTNPSSSISGTPIFFVVPIVKKSRVDHGQSTQCWLKSRAIFEIWACFSTSRHFDLSAQINFLRSSVMKMFRSPFSSLLFMKKNVENLVHWVDAAFSCFLYYVAPKFDKNCQTPSFKVASQLLSSTHLWQKLVSLEFQQNLSRKNTQQLPGQAFKLKNSLVVCWTLLSQNFVSRAWRFRWFSRRALIMQ